jgi:hypothetical protein
LVARLLVTASYLVSNPGIHQKIINGGHKQKVTVTLYQHKKNIKKNKRNVTRPMAIALNYILCHHCLTTKHCTEGMVPAKNCQGFQVLPPSMDFSRAQTPGRGESAIVTTTYATCAHPKVLILRTPISIYRTCTLEYSQCGDRIRIRVCISLPPIRLADPESEPDYVVTGKI